jgi:hypothetical protein
MAKQKRTVGLIAFLKGNTNPEIGMPGCANYDHHYGGCLFRDTCLVQDGKRCRYFERAVLPTAADIGLKALVYSLYEDHIGMIERLKIGKIRKCPDCGGELLPRQRYCQRCKRKRALEAKRNWKRKSRVRSR